MKSAALVFFFCKLQIFSPEEKKRERGRQRNRARERAFVLSRLKAPDAVEVQGKRDCILSEGEQLGEKKTGKKNKTLQTPSKGEKSKKRKTPSFLRRPHPYLYTMLASSSVPLATGTCSSHGLRSAVPKATAATSSRRSSRCNASALRSTTTAPPPPSSPSASPLLSGAAGARRRPLSIPPAAGYARQR